MCKRETVKTSCWQIRRMFKDVRLLFRVKLEWSSKRVCSENLSIIVSMPEHFIDFQTPRYISYTRPDDDDDEENKKKVVKEGYKKCLSVYTICGGVTSEASDFSLEFRK
jgi:hypothetical protein